VPHFSLEHFSLDAAPPFWAFSYVRGDPKKTSIVVVNGQDFEATSSLVSALKCHPTLHRFNAEDETDHPHFRAYHFWADAICIYFDRYQTKYSENLRLGPLFSKGFRFGLVGLSLLLIPPSRHFTYSLSRSPYPCFKLSEFHFRWP
jgi:hypothetical protein